MYKSIITFIFAAFFLASTVPAYAETAPIRFAVPPWPGAMVKTAVATQILNALGYKTSTVSMEASEVYKALEEGKVDVYMSAWLPTQEMLLAPMLKTKTIKVAGVNVAGTHTGLCVPGYAHAEGVKTVADLAQHADKFGSTVYTSEPGSGMYILVDELIKKNTDGLGNWELKGESVDDMLKDVITSFKDKKWVVFTCWDPHWMNITLDMRYLKKADASNKLIAESTINTIIRSDIKTKNPDAFLFLSRFNVSKQTQGKWTYHISLEEQDVNQTAATWITGNLDIVRQWLGNSKAANGERAVDVIETKF